LFHIFFVSLFGKLTSRLGVVDIYLLILLLTALSIAASMVFERLINYSALARTVLLGERWIRFPSPAPEQSLKPDLALSRQRAMGVHKDR
jgi:hypothetical protein